MSMKIIKFFHKMLIFIYNQDYEANGFEFLMSGRLVRLFHATPD